VPFLHEKRAAARSFSCWLHRAQIAQPAAKRLRTRFAHVAVALGMIRRTALHLLCALALASAAYGQPATPSPPPPAKAPVAPLPPPMPDVGADADLEPQITIKRRETETIEEVRVNGELRYVKVTPRYGLPYYLVPSGNGQTFLRYDSLDFGLKTPMWLLFSW